MLKNWIHNKLSTKNTYLSIKWLGLLLIPPVSKEFSWMIPDTHTGGEADWRSKQKIEIKNYTEKDEISYRECNNVRHCYIFTVSIFINFFPEAHWNHLREALGKEQIVLKIQTYFFVQLKVLLVHKGSFCQYYTVLPVPPSVLPLEINCIPGFRVNAVKAGRKAHHGAVKL